MRYYLGADLGSSKTHMAITDGAGQVLGFGKSGCANPQNVGYDGMLQAMQIALQAALHQAQLGVDQIAGSGFGISGLDWPGQKIRMQALVARLGLKPPYILVNDTIPGLVAGSDEGWGIGIVSGTGCNCRGRDRMHQHEGRVTGDGILMGEAAGSTELVHRAMQWVGYAWTKRGEPTALSQAFIEQVGAADLEDLIEGYTQGRYSIGHSFAPLVFQVAYAGDAVAMRLIHWAGCELGEMANAVIRQLSFESLEFDVVLSGSMFKGGALLTEPMQTTIRQLAPGARFVLLEMPPVVGAVILGMEAAGLEASKATRAVVDQSLTGFLQVERE